MRLSLADAESLATAALVAAGASPANARPTARALVAAEADGQAGHGLSRVASYAAQVKTGKVNGAAAPTAERVAAAALRIDADLGFAYPAIDLALRELGALVPASGIAAAAIHRSHHFGQAGAHAERLAERGLIGLVFANSPKAMAFWGGKKPMLGTNPLAFACPLPNAEPLVIDLALSVAARGKIMAAEKASKTIPPDWAFDADGRPTTDPAAALKGSMAAIGGAKGGALAIMVEILAAALTGGQFGWEATSVLDDKGGPPLLGHMILALDPDTLSGGAFLERMGTMLSAIAAEPGVRLPGTRRLSNRAKAAREGLEISQALYDEIAALAR
jgi:(2R)-3-sulfolactate dehydrogenase (NADP+)